MREPARDIFVFGDSTIDLERKMCRMAQTVFAHLTLVAEQEPYKNMLLHVTWTVGHGRDKFDTRLLPQMF